MEGTLVTLPARPDDTIRLRRFPLPPVPHAAGDETTRILLPGLRPEVPIRLETRRPAAGLRARLARRWRTFTASQFVGDLHYRRYTIAGAGVIVLAAAVVAIASRGYYWNGLDYVPIPAGQ